MSKIDLNQRTNLEEVLKGLINLTPEQIQKATGKISVKQYKYINYLLYFSGLGEEKHKKVEEVLKNSI